MRIKKMTATFGRLDNAVLTPGEGLTVIYGPNEGGKSTWAAFLKAMLYGIDTRERDKAGFLAEKNRYQPWTGSPMAGELQARWRDSEITVRRFAVRTSPFGGFEAVYSASGDPVPGLTGANVGQALIGAGRDLFVRTALLGQGAGAVTSVPELEKRVAALAASGQEDVSFSTAERSLRDWRNRRQSNRANGLIPGLEEELRARNQALAGMQEDRRCQEEAGERLARLEKEQEEIKGELEIWKRIDQHELNRRYAQARAEWERAQARVGDRTGHPVFEGMSGEEAWAFAQARQREREEALSENRRREGRRAQMEKNLADARTRARLCPLFAGVLLAAAVLLALTVRLWPAVIALAGVGAVLAGLTLLARRKAAALERGLEGLEPVPVPDCEGLLAQAAGYREALARMESARWDAQAAKRRMDDLYAQGGRPLDTLELLQPPARSRQELEARLEEVERERRDWHGRRQRALGALRADPLVLEAEMEGLEAGLRARNEELEALDMALEALRAANSTLRERFSPALNREAGTIFAALTGGKYANLALSRDFSAQVSHEGDPVPRSHLYLSAGTLDQLYLAVRLALCRLTLPDAPILLDDALAAFDDARMALALEFLSEMARERQVLLFTCHRREADWGRAHNIPVVYLTGNAAP